jgi:hypothetical protein
MTDHYVSADVLISVTLDDNDDERYTDEEIRGLLSSYANWNDWDVIEVQTIDRYTVGHPA